MILYWRDVGPIAYEAPQQIHTSAGYAAFTTQLLDSGLGWALRTDLPDRDTPGLTSPARLDDRSADAFVGHLLEELGDEGWHGIELVGADPSAFPEILSPEGAKLAQRAFCESEQPPVRVVWVRLSDTASPYIFVPHTPSPEVDRLLQIWIPGRERLRRRKYKRLGVVRLESMWGLEHLLERR